MLRLREALVVEGRYDKNTLSQLVEGVILPTDGFGIFKDQEKKALLRRLAQSRGVVVLTDSDGAGFLIRNHLKSILPPDQVKHAYIPDLYGKEKRKRQPGKEGKLGVEGMTQEVLEEALRRSGATFLEEPPPDAPPPLTKGDLYAWGLSGGEGSRAKRQALLKGLGLPEHLSANALLPVLSALCSREELEELVKKG